MKNGGVELADLEDVSEKVTFDFQDALYDVSTKTVSVEVVLANTSEETVLGPLKVRVLTLDSEYGVPEISNADNEERGSGASWDFTGLLDDETLKPGDRSKGKTLEFRLAELEPLQPVQKTGGLNFVSFEAKVLGKIEPSPDEEK